MLDFNELPPNGTRFEQLVRELFVRSNYEVHWTGVGPDGGRDLVVVEKANGNLAPFERRWLVSCKHYAHSGKSVGLDDITNIVDACRAVGANGFLLACSTQPSSTVVRRLEELQAGVGLITRYWDSIEIEKRLDTPETFPLTSLFFPASAQQRSWRIYNTESPSFWAANYKDYFLYLSSRVANKFPQLDDVENIVQKLESVPLPGGEQWEHHFLRPRGVFYDDKHGNFTVFADYLLPIGKIDSVTDPRRINGVLRDGMGLYEDNEGMWYLTNWDIRFRSIMESSDHFHLDHKDYYKRHMNNFRTGLPRGYTISELDPTRLSMFRV